MYTHVEAGCAAQNFFLQAQALGLEAGIIGALDEEPLRRAAGISGPGEPLLLLPAGHRK
jgi:nitroreductase